MGEKSGERKLETVERSFRIVEAIQELDGARVTELADHLDLSPSTVHGYLSTLEQLRYLIKEGDEYNVSLKFLDLGGYAAVRKEEFKVTEKKVKELAEDTGERAQFIVEEHGRGIYLHTEVEDRAVQINARIGKESYLHASAAGKSILAYHSEEQIDRIIDRWGLPRLTDNTITDRDALFEELETIRKEGVSFNRNESVPGLRAVGVPVKTLDEQVIGALSVSGPMNRMQGEWFDNDLPNLLLGTANEIELKIAYQ